MWQWAVNTGNNILPINDPKVTWNNCKQHYDVDYVEVVVYDFQKDLVYDRENYISNSDMQSIINNVDFVIEGCLWVFDEPTLNKIKQINLIV